MLGPTFQFADFQLDCGRFELRGNGRALRVERKPMELLILLVSRQGQLVTRTEITGEGWSNQSLRRHRAWHQYRDSQAAASAP